MGFKKRFEIKAPHKPISACDSSLGEDVKQKKSSSSAEFMMSAEKPKAKRRVRGGHGQDPFLKAVETDSSLHPPSSRRGSLSSGPPSSRRGGLVPSPPSSRRGARITGEPANTASSPSAASSKAPAASPKSTPSPSLSSPAGEPSSAEREKEPSRLVFGLFVAGLVFVVGTMLVMGIQARRLRTGGDPIPIDKKPSIEGAPSSLPEPGAASPPPVVQDRGEPPVASAAPSETSETLPSLPTATARASEPPAKSSAKTASVKPGPKSAGTKTAPKEGEPPSQERPPFQFDDQNK